jgi:hypothetical protein
MHQRTVRRCAAALAISAALLLSGARPAAARDFDVFERGMRWLAALLDLPAARQAPQGQSTPQNKSGALDPDQKVLPDGKGLGVDPNGAP